MNTKLSSHAFSLAKRSAHSLLASLALAPLALAGQLIVVDVAGTGDFNNIQDAVTASQTGDMILILAGKYAGFTVANKSVHIAAVEGAPVTLTGRVTVRNTSPNSIVTLRGLTSMGGTVPNGQEGLWAKNLQGTLRVDECDFQGFRSSPQVPPAVLIEQCNAVTFTSSTVTGIPYSPAGKGLVADDSNLALFRTTIQGGSSSSVGGTGVELLGMAGQLFLTDSTIRGGYGYDGYCDEWNGEDYPGDGGDGLVNNGWDAWAQNSTVVGGSGGTADWSYYWCNASDGYDGQDLSGPLTLLPGNGRELDMHAVVSPSNNTLRITVRGEVGDRVFLQASLAGDFQLSPRQDGPVLLASPFLGLLSSMNGGSNQLGGGIPLGFQSLFLGVIGNAGNLTYQVPVLALPANAVRNVQLQAALTDTNGVVWMSNARTLSTLP